MFKSALEKARTLSTSAPLYIIKPKIKKEMRHKSSHVCWELSPLVSSKCRGRSRKIINMHNGRVNVEVGRGKS